MLREQPAPARLADLVAGPTDPLQAPAHRSGRLDLDDQVDGAHVDAQLEGAGGDQAPSGRPASARPRSGVVARGLNEPWCAFTSSWPGAGGRPSCSAARDSPSSASSLRRVASRSARRREFTNTRVERCSWISSSSRGCMAGQMLRRTGPAATGPLAGSSMISPRAPMSSTGTTTSMSSSLRMPASTTVTGRGRPVVLAAQEAGDLVERALRGRQADALEGTVDHRLQPLERQGQVGAPLGGGQGVDLVDDHRLDPAQGLTGLRGQHQVQRLGRGDQQVGRVADELAPLVGRGVACPHPDRGHGDRHARAARPARAMPCSGDRRFFSTSTASARSGET